EVAGAFNVRALDGVNSFDDRQQYFKCGSNVLAPINGGIPVKDLLKNLRVRDQRSFFGHKSFEKPAGIGFMRMRSADQIHRNVRVDEDHRCRPRYPASISFSIWSMSAVGAEWRAAACMASSFREVSTDASPRRA